MLFPMHVNNGHVTRALTIAGSDSGGGAGIQADLKTMHQFQVYGMSAITAITAQNTLGVQGIMDVDPAFVRQQLQSIAADLAPDAVKTGMLASPHIICEVAEFLSHAGTRHIVVDPVMIAKGGTALLRADALTAMKERLFPMARVLTPNLPEAETLCGYTLQSWSDCRDAAMMMADMGPEIVVIKGGHISHPWADDCMFTTFTQNTGHPHWAIDLIYQKRAGFTFLATPRVATQKSHGTGCTYAAAITAMLARGESPLQAIATAKAFVYHALHRAQTWDVGSGHGPLDHSVSVHPAPNMMANGSYAFLHDHWVRGE